MNEQSTAYRHTADPYASLSALDTAIAKKRPKHMMARPIHIHQIADKGVEMAMPRKNMDINDIQVAPVSLWSDMLPQANLPKAEIEALEEECGTAEMTRRVTEAMLGFRRDEYGFILDDIEDGKSGRNSAKRAILNASENMVEAVNTIIADHGPLIRKMSSLDPEVRTWATRTFVQVMEDAGIEYERRANRMVDGLDWRVLQAKAKNWQDFEREMDQNWRMNTRTLTDPQNMFAQFVLMSFCPPLAIALLLPLLLPMLASPFAHRRSNALKQAGDAGRTLRAEEKGHIAAARISAASLAMRIAPLMASELPGDELIRLIDDTKESTLTMAGKIVDQVSQMHLKVADLCDDGRTIRRDSEAEVQIRKYLSSISGAAACLATGATADERGMYFLPPTSDISRMTAVRDVAVASRNAHILSVDDSSGRPELTFIDSTSDPLLAVAEEDARRYADRINITTAEAGKSSRDYILDMTECTHPNIDDIKGSYAEHIADKRRYISYTLDLDDHGQVAAAGANVDVRPATIVSAINAIDTTSAADKSKLSEAFLRDMSMRLYPQQLWDKLTALEDNFAAVVDANYPDLTTVSKNEQDFVAACAKEIEAEKNLILATCLATEIKRLVDERGSTQPTLAEEIMSSNLALHVERAAALEKEARDVLDPIRTFSFDPDSPDETHETKEKASLLSVVKQMPKCVREPQGDRIMVISEASGLPPEQIPGLTQGNDDRYETCEREMAKQRRAASAHLMRIMSSSSDSMEREREISTMVHLANRTSADEVLRRLVISGVGHDVPANHKEINAMRKELDKQARPIPNYERPVPKYKRQTLNPDRQVPNYERPASEEMRMMPEDVKGFVPKHITQTQQRQQTPPQEMEYDHEQKVEESSKKNQKGWVPFYESGAASMLDHISHTTEGINGDDRDKDGDDIWKCSVSTPLVGFGKQKKSEDIQHIPDDEPIVEMGLGI